MLFGEAAEACAVSQPALSMQIRELEDVLEVNLVERRKSGVELTEKGEEIARPGRTILASVRDLLDYAKHREPVLSGSLKLGVIPSIAPYLLPDALPELQRLSQRSTCSSARPSPRPWCTSSEAACSI